MSEPTIDKYIHIFRRCVYPPPHKTKVIKKKSRFRIMSDVLRCQHNIQDLHTFIFTRLLHIVNKLLSTQNLIIFKFYRQDHVYTCIEIEILGLNN